MGISKHNRSRGKVFVVDTTGFEYKALGELFDAKNPDRTFSVYGAYIGRFYSKREKREVECCFVASDGYFISLPAHLVETVKEILSDQESIEQMNASEAGLVIRPYEKDGETFYSADFVELDNRET